MIEAAGNMPVVFVGLSVAGPLAVNFAATYPHLVERLVLIGSRPCSPGAADNPIQATPEWQQWFQQIVTQVQAEHYEEATSLFLAQCFSEPGCRNLIEVFLHMWQQASWLNFRDFLTVDPGRELRPLLPLLQAPTLVIHGEEDFVVPVEAGHYLATHIPGAQFYLFKGGCHSPLFTATAEFAQVIRHFIRTGRPT